MGYQSLQAFLLRQKFMYAMQLTEPAPIYKRIILAEFEVPVILPVS